MGDRRTRPNALVKGASRPSGGPEPRGRPPRYDSPGEACGREP
jgi:hypothetical protein